MPYRKSILPILILALTLVVPSHRALAGTDSGHYTTLGPNLKQLKDDFNARVGSVRLLYVVGPTCPICLRGMDDLDKALASTASNPRVHTFIVYVPALGAKETDIAPTLSLLNWSNVSRYWDPEGASGHLFDKVLGINEFAWDVWMIYRPDQKWAGSQPPAPDFWMDQLPSLPESRFLDASTFAKHVRALIPTDSAASK